MIFFTAIWITPFIWHGHEMKHMNPTPRFELHCFRALVWNVINSLFFLAAWAKKGVAFDTSSHWKNPLNYLSNFEHRNRNFGNSCIIKRQCYRKCFKAFYFFTFILILPGDEFLVSPFGCRHGFLGTPWQYFRLWILKVNRLLANSNAKRCV